MNKKSFTLFGITLACATTIAVSAVAVIGSRNYNANLMFADGDARKYEFVFDSSSLVEESISHEAGTYHLYFDLYKEYTYLGSNYSIDSFDCDIYSGNDGENINFENDDDIFEITEAYYDSFEIIFPIIKYATFDTNKSKINCAVKGETGFDANFSLWDDSVEEYNYYSASFDTYSRYGKNIKVTSIELVFSCL